MRLISASSITSPWAWWTVCISRRSACASLLCRRRAAWRALKEIFKDWGPGVSETTELSMPGHWGHHHMQYDVWRIEYEGRRVPGHVLGNEMCHCLTALSCDRTDSGDYVTSRVGHLYYDSLNYTQNKPQPRTNRGLPDQPVPHGAGTVTAAQEHFTFYELACKPLEEKLFSLPNHLHCPPVSFWVMHTVSSERRCSTNGTQVPVCFSGWQFTLSPNSRRQHRAQAGGNKIPTSQRAPSPPRAWDHFHKHYRTRLPSLPQLCKPKGFGVKSCRPGTAVGGLTFSTWNGEGGRAVPAVTANSVSHQDRPGPSPQIP